MSNREEESDIIYGRNAVLSTLKSDRDIHKVYFQEGLSGNRLEEIEAVANSRKAQVYQVPKEKLDRLTDGENHQGVVVTVAAMDYASLNDLFEVAEERSEEPFFVLLDGIEDPHNLGSILRTADAAGVHGVIIPERRAVGLTATVAKTSAGAIEHVKVARVTNMVDTIQELKERGLWVFGTDMDGEDYRTWNSEGAIALVIGNEGKGISRLVKENCDGIVTLPMSGQIQSLNAGVATALMMYEVARERLPN